jgi:hypothetical protein
LRARRKGVAETGYALLFCRVAPNRRRGWIF